MQNLLSDVMHHGNRIIFFRDDKTFTVGSGHDRQNDHIACFDWKNSGLCYISKTKHPASIVMLAIVVTMGDKMFPIWFKAGYWLTAADYLTTLRIKVLP